MFDSYVEKAKLHFPKLTIKYKNESLFMRFLSFVLFFNKAFSTKFITTIGNTVYFPSKEFIYKNEASATVTLMHELVHIHDSRNKLYFILYMFPQILFLFGFLGFLNPWLFLLFLFILPLPSFRAYYEFKAYVMTLYVYRFFEKTNDYNVNYETIKNNIINNFITSNYYFMFPFKSFLNKKFDDKISIILLDKVPGDLIIYGIIDNILN